MSVPIDFYEVVERSFAGRTAVTLTNYDVLNRLKGMNALYSLSTTVNIWTPSLLDDFKEDVSYDANDNILSYRHPLTTK